MGPGSQDAGPRDPGAPLKSFKVGPGIPLQSLKVGPPHLFLMNLFFSEYFFAFFTYLFLCLF